MPDKPKRPGTEPGAARPARRIGAPLPDVTVGRTQTYERLKAEVGLYAKTVERHDEAIDEWLKPLATKLPAQLETLGASIAKLDATATANGAAMERLADQLRDHDERIAAVEQRAADHEARLLLLDEQRLDPRLRALEQGVVVEAAIEKTAQHYVAKQGKWRSRTIRAAISAAIALAGALAGYLTG